MEGLVTKRIGKSDVTSKHPYTQMCIYIYVYMCVRFDMCIHIYIYIYGYVLLVSTPGSTGKGYFGSK